MKSWAAVFLKEIIVHLPARQFASNLLLQSHPFRAASRLRLLRKRALRFGRMIGTSLSRPGRMIISDQFSRLPHLELPWWRLLFRWVELLRVLQHPNPGLVRWKQTDPIPHHRAAYPAA